MGGGTHAKAKPPAYFREHTRRAPTKITRNKIRYHTVDSLVPERPADSTAQPNRTQPEPDPTLKNDQVIPETKFPA